jgi:hypothetical protein
MSDHKPAEKKREKSRRFRRVASLCNGFTAWGFHSLAVAQPSEDENKQRIEASCSTFY